MTTWKHNSKSFVLYIYFKGASTSPFAACSVNNRGCEEEAIITKQPPFLQCLFSSDVFMGHFQKYYLSNRKRFPDINTRGVARIRDSYANPRRSRGFA